MTCLGGTVDDPKIWYDRHQVEQLGRPCLRTPSARYARQTDIDHCRNCVAYRGQTRRGMPQTVGATMIDTDGMEVPRNLTKAEYEAQFDMEPEAWWALLQGGTFPLTDASFKFVREVDDEAREVWNAYHRQYRKDHPGLDKRSRTAYRREQRSRKILDSAENRGG